MSKGTFSADGKVYSWTGPTGVHFTDVATADGTFYRDTTPKPVVEALEAARKAHKRVRLFLGDRETGKQWMDEYGVTGYVARSMGPVMIPILLPSTRSHGGGAILCDCIVRLLVEGREVYRHPEYKVPELSVGYDNPEFVSDEGKKKYPYYVKNSGDEIARFKTESKARRWVAFMKGERMAA